MLKNVFHLPVFVIVFFFYPVVQAAQVDGLYEAQVPVASQDAAERSKGLREAFRKVIMKASGQSSFYSDQADVLSRARDHVEQFGYRSREQDGKRQLLLWARFNPEGVRRAVRDAGLPVWPEERPSTLVWLAIEEGDDRMILAGDSEHVAQKTLNEIARERGLPPRAGAKRGTRRDRWAGLPASNSVRTALSPTRSGSGWARIVSRAADRICDPPPGT